VKPEEIKGKTLAEREKLISELRLELFHLKLKSKTGQLDKSHRIKEVKGDIARVLTFQNQEKGV